MDKITYLAELAEGLARWVPERERRDILRWYAEYFEEAGPGREAEVVAELGDPWALSCRLAVEGGYVSHEKAAAWRPRKVWPRVLLGTAVGMAITLLVFNIGMLFTNISRNTIAYSEAEPVTVVDWGTEEYWGDYNVAFIGDPGSMGFYYTDGGNLAVFDSIDADIALGNIEVIAGDDYTVSVTRSGDLSGYEPWWEVRDGALRLRAGGGSQMTESNIWDSLKSMLDANQWAVDVTITVPEEAFLNKVSVKTGLGDVLLWGMTTETVTVETGLGNVECYNVWRVRKLDLSTGLGDVILGMDEVRGGLNISLESGKGNVEASLLGSEEDYSYTLESGTGAVTLNGGYRGGKAERKADVPYKLNAESGMGDVNVYFISD